MAMLSMAVHSHKILLHDRRQLHKFLFDLHSHLLDHLPPRRSGAIGCEILVGSNRTHQCVCCHEAANLGSIKKVPLRINWSRGGR